MKLKKLLLGISGIALASTIAIAEPTDENYPIYIQDLYTNSNYSIQTQTTPQRVEKSQTPTVQKTYEIETKSTTTQPVKYTQTVDQMEIQSEKATVTEEQEIKQVKEQEEITSIPKVTSSTIETEEQETVITQKAPYYNNWSIEEAQEKVSIIGNKLVETNGYSDMGIKFIVSDEPTVNAYADGNRNVVIFTGLLELCDSEDELAFIMSHEIAHIAGFHIQKRKIAYKAAGAGSKAAKKKLGGIKSKVSQMAKEYGVEKYGVKPELIDKTVDTAAVAGVTYYDRRHEIDADTDGMDIMKKAGYNPLAGIAIMYRIGDNYNDIFTDHPSTDKRVVKMYNHASENAPEELKKGYDSIYYNEAISIMKSEN